MIRTDYNLPVFVDTDLADLNEYSRQMALALKGQIDRFGNPLTFKGVVATLNDLPENATAGDIYAVSSINKNYVYSGEEWLEYSQIAAVEENNLEVHFLYRGQNKGDCSLIKTKDKTILIDLGITDAATLIAKLYEENVSKVDYLIISHFHGDHVMGYTENYDASNWTALFNSNIDFSECTFIFPKTPDWSKFIYGDTPDSTNRNIAGAGYLPTLEANITSVITNAGLTIIRPNDLSVIDIDEETSLKFLNCDENNFTDYYDEVAYNSTLEKYTTIYNNFSMVVELTHGSHIVLFTGDIEELAQEKIVDDLTYCDVLKIQHHGTNANVYKDYYLKLKPKVAMLMNTGTTNRNNPMQVGLKLLGTEVYASNESHDVVVTSTKDGINTVSDKGRASFRANIGKALEVNDFASVYTLEVFGTEIPQNADLNEYTTPGIYYSNNSTITQSLSNCPVTSGGFKLIVEYNQASNRIVHTIKVNDGTRSLSYVRTYVDSWGEWAKVQKAVILYDSASGSTTGNVTLSKAISNFDEIEILYSVANYRKSVKIPVTGASVNTTLDCIYVGTSNMVVGSQDCTLSGTTITRGNMAGKNINLSDNTITDNSSLTFTIYKVIGY
jgi:beta-lactamase superfamily II metal-dependent hydrolase